MVDVLPPAQHEQPLQTWAGRPGCPPSPSVGPDRSSIWQTSGTPPAAAREPPSPGLGGNPVGERQAHIKLHIKCQQLKQERQRKRLTPSAGIRVSPWQTESQNQDL